MHVIEILHVWLPLLLLYYYYNYYYYYHCCYYYYYFYYFLSITWLLLSRETEAVSTKSI